MQEAPFRALPPIWTSSRPSPTNGSGRLSRRFPISGPTSPRADDPRGGEKRDCLCSFLAYRCLARPADEAREQPFCGRFEPADAQQHGICGIRRRFASGICPLCGGPFVIIVFQSDGKCTSRDFRGVHCPIVQLNSTQRVCKLQPQARCLRHSLMRRPRNEAYVRT